MQNYTTADKLQLKITSTGFSNFKARTSDLQAHPCLQALKIRPRLLAIGFLLAASPVIHWQTNVMTQLGRQQHVYLCMLLASLSWTPSRCRSFHLRLLARWPLSPNTFFTSTCTPSQHSLAVSFIQSLCINKHYTSIIRNQCHDLETKVSKLSALEFI